MTNNYVLLIMTHDEAKKIYKPHLLFLTFSFVFSLLFSFFLISMSTFRINFSTTSREALAARRRAPSASQEPIAPSVSVESSSPSRSSTPAVLSDVPLTSHSSPPVEFISEREVQLSTVRLPSFSAAPVETNEDILPTFEDERILPPGLVVSQSSFAEIPLYSPVVLTDMLRLDDFYKDLRTQDHAVM